MHTETCNAAARASNEAEAVFRAAHPGCCLDCGGWGGRNHPGTMETPPEFGECRKCLAEGKCPWCGDALPDGDEDTMACKCGWSYGADGMAEPHACWGCDEED